MLHEKLAAYLELIEKTIDGLENVDIEHYSEERISQSDVILSIRIRFSSHALLELNEAVFVENDSLKHRKYRYHFQNGQHRLVFRYDSAPHFPELPTFPHHKHLPNATIASTKPSIIAAIKEALANY